MIRDYLKEHILITDGAMGTYYASKFHDETLVERENFEHPERIAQIHLKIALDELDCPLQLIDAERSMIILRNGQLAHMTNLTFFTFSGKSPEIIRYIIRDWPGLCKRK